MTTKRQFKRRKEVKTLQNGVYCASAGGGVKSEGGIAVLDFAKK